MPSDQPFPFATKYDWEHRHKLGQGGFGIVYKVTDLSSQQAVAIKQMDMTIIYQQKMLDMLKTEIQLMQTLKSQHLISLKDYWIGNRQTYIVLELCEGDLRAKMEENGGRVGEEQAIEVFGQIVKGFRVMLDMGYVHRDVKPENVLCKAGKYKVSDYGFSCKADLRYLKKLDLICGTPLYMSPQLLKSQPYTAKSDIWSLGIMLFQMIFGYPPWPCRSQASYLTNILTQPLSFPHDAKLGEHTKDFIKKCLVVEESQRMGWKELFQHPMVREKSKGKPIQLLRLKKSAVEVMRRVQETAVRKGVDVGAVLQARRIEKMDQRMFFEVCRMIDPTISSFEVQLLFKELDTSKDNFIDYNEFKVLILQTDFRDADDISSRYIRQVVEVAKRNKVSVDKLFQVYDRDHSGTIDKAQLTLMLQQLLPKITPLALDKIWSRFDKDMNSKISLKQFTQQILSGIPNPTSPTQQLTQQRTTRCLKSLAQAIKYYNVSLEDTVRIFDRNGDCQLDEREFRAMALAVSRGVREEELRMMFAGLDVNGNGRVAIAELKALLSL